MATQAEQLLSALDQFADFVGKPQSVADRSERVRIMKDAARLWKELRDRVQVLPEASQHSGTWWYACRIPGVSYEQVGTEDRLLALELAEYHQQRMPDHQTFVFWSPEEF